MEVSPLWGFSTEVLLAHASPINWPVVAKCANRMQILMSSRGSIKCGACDNYVKIFSFTYLFSITWRMASFWKTWAGPIEPSDQHDNCIACLGLCALEESDCGHCVDLPVCVLQTCCIVAHGLFGVRPTAYSVPVVGHPPASSPSRRQEQQLAAPPSSAVTLFPSHLPRGLLPPTFEHRRLHILQPGGRGLGLYVHFGLGERVLGGIRTWLPWQWGAPRPSAGACEGHDESCPGARAYLEPSGGDCRE